MSDTERPSYDILENESKSLIYVLSLLRRKLQENRFYQQGYILKVW